MFTVVTVQRRDGFVQPKERRVSKSPDQTAIAPGWSATGFVWAESLMACGYPRVTSGTQGAPDCTQLNRLAGETRPADSFRRAAAWVGAAASFRRGKKADQGIGCGRGRPPSRRMGSPVRVGWWLRFVGLPQLFGVDDGFRVGLGAGTGETSGGARRCRFRDWGRVRAHGGRNGARFGSPERKLKGEIVKEQGRMGSGW